MESHAETPASDAPVVEANAESAASGGKHGRQPKRRRRRSKDPVKDPDRKRRRSTKRAAKIWKFDRWALKAVTQLKLFIDWMRHQEHNIPLLFTHPPHTKPIEHALCDLPSPLRYEDAKAMVILSGNALPSVESVLKSVDFGDGATDVSSYESDGSPLSINLHIAKWLIETRKSIRLTISQGPWPAEDLLINPIEIQKRTESRFRRLCGEIISGIREACSYTSKFKTVVYLRLGLDVARDERSLIVCGTGDDAEAAKGAAYEIWKRILKLSLENKSVH